ncbi:MAG: tyrosine-type recombinase/integrase [Actinomycetota bacterium]|nr:tyrosine-type recombinase/integrase [Actinomycetota bacterium]
MPQQGTATKSRTMGIRKRHRASGTRYEARWYEADGTERARTFRTEDEAQAQLDEVRHGKRRGTYVSPALQRTPFGQTAEEWLAAKERKPRTVKVYRHMFDTWLKPWMDRPVGSIGYSDVTALVAEMRTAGRAAQTVHNVFNVVHGVLGYAVDAGYLAANPAARVRRNLPARNDRPERRPLTAEQVEAVAAALPPPYGLLVRFAAWSGLRAGEVGGLRVGRVNVLRNEVTVAETVVRLRGGMQAGTPKSRKSHRTFKIPPTVVHELAAHIAAHNVAPGDYVFSEADGGPLRHEAFYRRYYRPAVAAVGRADATFHTLRHTYASLMAGTSTCWN